jgi:hypothetical protein
VKLLKKRLARKILDMIAFLNLQTWAKHLVRQPKKKKRKFLIEQEPSRLSKNGTLQQIQTSLDM